MSRLSVFLTCTTFCVVFCQPIVPAGEQKKKAAIEDFVLGDAKDWQGRFSRTFAWTFEKNTDDANHGRIYIGILDSDKPDQMEAYAKKMLEKNFVHTFYVFTEITEKSKLADGFVIKGRIVATDVKDAKPELGLVIVRTIAGVKVECRSGKLSNDAVQKEVIDLFKTGKFKK